MGNLRVDFKLMKILTRTKITKEVRDATGEVRR